MRDEKRCPLTKDLCSEECAWFFAGMCAMCSIAEDLYGQKQELEEIKEKM